MELSLRLMAVASLVEPADVVADVGTDHAYIPIYLVEKGICKRAIAMDVRKGPLERAGEHIRSHNLSEYIEIRLSDGVSMLRAGEADALVVAGMGGRLIRKILDEGREVLRTLSRIVLQPQSETEALRRFLQEDGYRIVREDMILEDGKYYPMMAVKRGVMRYGRDIDFAFGKLLLEQRHPVLYRYLRKQEEMTLKLNEQLSAGQAEPGASVKRRLKELSGQLSMLREALSCYGEPGE